MSLESKICRAYIDVAEVTKNHLITTLLETKEKNNLTNDQINGLVKALSQSLDASASTGLNAIQRVVNAVGTERVKEVEGKKKPKGTKSEAA